MPVEAAGSRTATRLIGVVVPVGKFNRRILRQATKSERRKRRLIQPPCRVQHAKNRRAAGDAKYVKTIFKNLQNKEELFFKNYMNYCKTYLQRL